MPLTKLLAAKRLGKLHELPVQREDIAEAFTQGELHGSPKPDLSKEAGGAAHTRQSRPRREELDAGPGRGEPKQKTHRKQREQRGKPSNRQEEPRAEGSAKNSMRDLGAGGV